MLHDYWMYVDDLPLVQEVLPHTRTVLDWYAGHLRQDGLLGKVGWWEFADWTGNYHYGVPPEDADGGSTFLTLQFIEALQAAAEMESQYGSQERARGYRETVQTRLKLSIAKAGIPRTAFMPILPQKSPGAGRPIFSRSCSTLLHVINNRRFSSDSSNQSRKTTRIPESK